MSLVDATRTGGLLGFEIRMMYGFFQTYRKYNSRKIVL